MLPGIRVCAHMNIVDPAPMTHAWWGTVEENIVCEGRSRDRPTTAEEPLGHPNLGSRRRGETSDCPSVEITNRERMRKALRL